MSKKLMLIAVAVFGLSLCAAAQNSSSPAGTTNPQPAPGQTAPAKPAKKGRKPSKKPAKKASKKAGQAAKTTSATPAPAPAPTPTK